MADQAVAIEHSVDRADGRDFDAVRQSSHQALADLACSPAGFLAPGCDDCRSDLLGQLVGIPKGPAGPIAETFQPTFLITVKDLVPGLPGNAELPAQGSHALAILEPDHKSHSLVHYRTFPPWHVLHPALLRQNVSPMSPERSVTYVSERSKNTSAPPPYPGTFPVNFNNHR